MYKMLFISRYCGHASSPYGGSKVHYYYLNQFNSDKNFLIKLINFSDPGEFQKLDYAANGIDADVTVVDVSPRRLLFLLMHNWKNIPNYFGKTMGLENGIIKKIVLKKLRALKRAGYIPDIIILEWTQIALMIHEIGKLYPEPLYVAMVQDVAFNKYGRSFASSKGLRRFLEFLRFRSIKYAEIDCLQSTDMVAVLSEKDRTLLAENGISSRKLHVVSPYYTDYRNIRYDPRSSTILFFGAMDRAENYQSIIWFIRNVFVLLPSEYSLVIAGNKPHFTLAEFASSRIKITGFVPDITPFFQNSFCMVAPLLLGAGIKIKILEAMSAGLPVLTNAIGIEGIPAKDGVHYLHCETPDEYIETFNRIHEKKIDLVTISNNAKSHIALTYNLQESYLSLRNAIMLAYGNKKGAME
jgi:glycosyltransferase involved in cell wall biosynthesis